MLFRDHARLSGTQDTHTSRPAYESFGLWSETAFDRGRDRCRCHYRMRRSDGSTFPSEHLVQILRDEAGRRQIALSVVRDLTRALPTHMPWAPDFPSFDLGSVSSHVPDALFQGMMTASGETRFPFVQGKLSEGLGVPPERVHADPDTLLGLVHPDDQATLADQVAHMRYTDRTVDFPLRVFTTAGERLHHMATHYALTGLINRPRFGADLDQTLQRSRYTGQCLAVLAVDIARMIETMNPMAR